MQSHGACCGCSEWHCSSDSQHHFVSDLLQSQKQLSFVKIVWKRLATNLFSIHAFSATGSLEKITTHNQVTSFDSVLYVADVQSYLNLLISAFLDLQFLPNHFCTYFM